MSNFVDFLTEEDKNIINEIKKTGNNDLYRKLSFFSQTCELRRVDNIAYYYYNEPIYYIYNNFLYIYKHIFSILIYGKYM